MEISVSERKKKMVERKTKKKKKNDEEKHIDLSSSVLHLSLCVFLSSFLVYCYSYVYWKI
jgi:hypothetical protein